MSDCGAALAYLCRTCCCWRDAEITPDGSHFRSSGKRDPREKLVEDAFMARNYRKDESGRFHVQPAPTSAMTATRTDSGESKTSAPALAGLPVEAPEIQITPPTEKSKSVVEEAQLNSVGEEVQTRSPKMEQQDMAKENIIVPIP